MTRIAVVASLLSCSAAPQPLIPTSAVPACLPERPGALARWVVYLCVLRPRPLTRYGVRIPRLHQMGARMEVAVEKAGVWGGGAWLGRDELTMVVALIDGEVAPPSSTRRGWVGCGPTPCPTRW
jgi:hypothetical protein